MGRHIIVIRANNIAPLFLSLFLFAIPGFAQDAAAPKWLLIENARVALIGNTP